MIPSENTGVSIVGNETIEELVNKTSEVEAIKDKLGVCVMIITHLEMKNSIRPGSFIHKIGMSKKYPPIRPENLSKMGLGHRSSSMFNDINNFLYYLKKTDKNCYEALVSTYEKISKKESNKELLVTWGIIIGVVLIVVFLLNRI